MRKFKNKTTGIVGELKEDGHLHFTRGDKNISCHETIWFGFVENSCDWEEVAQKDYEILTIYSENYGVIFKDEQGHFRYVSNCGLGFALSLEQALEKNYKIRSVKRLSDNLVFSVGDRAQSIGKYPHTITSIEIRQKHINREEKDGIDRIWLNWEENCGGNWLENVEIVKEPILTTFDGVELFGGETVYGVTDSFQLCFTSMATKENVQACRVFAKRENAEEYIRTFKNYKTVDGKQIKEGDVFYCYDNKRFKCIESKYGQFKASKWDGKRYRTKEEVEELILMNKPCLSLNELLDSWGEVGSREFYLKSPMFFNFKKFAENKIKNGR